MKKIAVFFVAALLLLFTACSSGSSGVDPHGKNPTAPEAAKSAASSVFDRSVKYDSFTPTEGLTLPVPSDEITDMAQIEKRLYFLTDGAVSYLDLGSGESGKLFDAGASAIAAHGGKLYTYLSETSVLSEYDPSGSLLNELKLETDGVDSVEELEVTDGCYVFKGIAKKEKITETNILIYSRETNEQTLSKPAPSSGIRFYPYKGDKLLSVTADSVFGAMLLNSFDAATGKSENLQTLDIRDYPAVAYCPKTDTALVFGIPNEVTFDGDSTVFDAPCPITEYSLSDADSVVLNRYRIDVKYGTEFFVGTYENIVWAVSTAGDGCLIYDFLNPPESITVLGNAASDLIYGFEKESGILVRIAHTDKDKLILKLMAGDSDFDIFNESTGFQDFVNAGVYVDLKGIESLNSRISGNAAADLAVSCDGKYFGVPTAIKNYYTEENYPENGSNFSYSLVVSEAIYFAKNVDVAEGRYDDPDGSELYKLLKYINDNPTGSRDKMPFGDGVTLLNSNVYLMNPKSQNSDGAIKFLEYLFDVYNGDIPGVVPDGDIYPRLGSTENCYAEWRCRPLEIIGPIFDARSTVLGKKGDLSSSELKRLAKEAASEVAMRIGE